VFPFVAPAEVEGVAERFAATPFDVEGVFWSHRGETCTFDMMVEEFGIATEPLLRLAAIMRGADTGRMDAAPQAAGHSPPRLGCRACMRTISRSSKPEWRFTTPSIGGAGTPRRKPTRGTRRGREPEVSEALAAPSVSPAPAAREFPSVQKAFRVWLKVAAQSFGGPGGHIAVMHRIILEEERWVSESRFLHAFNYCMLLPGPEAQQLTT
jgi:chromate resistance exported protein/chromate transporter